MRLAPFAGRLTAPVMALLVGGWAPAAQWRQPAVWVSDSPTRTIPASVHMVISTHLSLQVRCQQGSLEVVLNGWPDGERRIRRHVAHLETINLRAAIDGEPVLSTRWVSHRQRSAFSHALPAPFARRLLTGQTFKLSSLSGDEEDATGLAVIQLPVDSGPVAQVLEACGSPLVDARDALIAAATKASRNYRWLRNPRPEYPGAASFNRIRQGEANLSCTRGQDGSVYDCRIESEMPLQMGFGQAALRSMREVRLADDQTSDIDLIVYRMQFRLE